MRKLRIIRVFNQWGYPSFAQYDRGFRFAFRIHKWGFALVVIDWTFEVMRYGVDLEFHYSHHRHSFPEDISLLEFGRKIEEMPEDI